MAAAAALFTRPTCRDEQHHSTDSINSVLDVRGVHRPGPASRASRRAPCRALGRSPWTTRRWAPLPSSPVGDFHLATGWTEPLRPCCELRESTSTKHTCQAASSSSTGLPRQASQGDNGRRTGVLGGTCGPGQPGRRTGNLRGHAERTTARRYSGQCLSVPRERQRSAPCAGLILTTRPMSSSPGGEADGHCPRRAESTEHQIDVNAGVRPGASRCAGAACACGPTGPGGARRPARGGCSTPASAVDGTEVRQRERRRTSRRSTGGRAAR